MKKNFALPLSRFVAGPKGPRALSESLAYCTRCNACVQSCPSYLVRREELFSPRGRNQLLRLLAEGKIKPGNNLSLIRQTALDCLLCGRCTAACAGQIPTAEHMLILRRAAQIRPLPRLLHMLLKLRTEKPVCFARIMEFLLFLRKWGGVRLLRLGGLTALPALRWIKQADDMLPLTAGSLRSLLKKTGTPCTAQRPHLLYLPSLEAQWLDPDIGLLTLQLCKSKQTDILFGETAGLFEYLYGREKDLLKTARRFLIRWEKYSPSKPLPLLTDSIDVYVLLKNYPVLFAAWPGWKKRAEKLAAQVRFVTDFPFPKPKQIQEQNAALDPSCLVFPAPEECLRHAQKILKTHFGKNLVECDYSIFPSPHAGAHFARTETARETEKKCAQSAARRQIQAVYTLSGFAALGWNAALKRRYPAARAKHIICLYTGL